MTQHITRTPAPVMLPAAPTNPGKVYQAAVAARTARRPGEAARLATLGAALGPDIGDFPRLLGNLAMDGDRAGAAAAFYTRALTLDPTDHRSYRSLALSFSNANRPDIARQVFDQALAMGAPPSFRILKALALPAVVQDRAEIERVRAEQVAALQALAEDPVPIADPLAEIGATNFLAAYQGEDDRPLQEAFARALLGGHPDLAWTAPHIAAGHPRSDGRRHIVVASASFFDHTISRLYLGLIRDLPRDRFTVTVARTDQRVDGMTAAVDRAADKVVLLPMDLAAARQAVAALEPDLLFYPDLGMEPLTYLMAFARLAPVQMTTLGHPVTTGIPAIDGFLSGVRVEPEGAQAHYSERLWLTPSLPMPVDLPPLPRSRPGKAAIGLDDRTPLYGCPQSLFKFHPDFDEIVLGLLDRDPASRLVLIKGREGWLDALLGRWERRQPGITEQIVAVNPMSRQNYVALMALCDVALETRPFGGGNSVVEALAAGTPVVTWPARFARGRCAKSVLETMGLDDLVVDGAAAYIDLAHDLAHDPAARRAMTDRIHAARDRLIRPAGVTAEIAQVFEDALEL
ncbi:MAG: hypothetical protein NXI16_05045 [Alphaproteobacteria bacterium]|nr:hypothetical protein [Alphaproteobacteria bacterium]